MVEGVKAARRQHAGGRMRVFVCVRCARAGKSVLKGMRPVGTRNTSLGSHPLDHSPACPSPRYPELPPVVAVRVSSAH